MSVLASTRPATDSAAIDEAIESLRQGAKSLVTMSLAGRKRLIEQCLDGITEQTQPWVEAAWKAKRIQAKEAARAEDIMMGPLPAFRCLRLLHHTLSDIERTGKPLLPGKPYEKNNQVRIPIFPTRHLYDSLLFGPLTAETWMQPSVAVFNLFGENIERVQGKANDQPSVAVVLGAGNVSSIPIADAVAKIFQENRAVILKMNPVNEYLGPFFEMAFEPLIKANLLRIVYGDGAVGQQLTDHEGVDEIHVTGSDRTHDAIVWGSGDQQAERKANNTPRLEKAITSELGNVSPWIIVPGKYSRRQLNFQAENIVASITSNVSFNCIATKMLIMQKGWPQGEMLLDRIQELLANTPKRFAYYPGAVERFARFSGQSNDRSESRDPRLPWTIVRDVSIDSHPHLFREESFVCVTGATTLESTNDATFLNDAVEFVNQKMWGTLSAAVTVPDAFRKNREAVLDQAIRDLNYGTIGINQWPGVAYALMSPPWGAFPGSTLQDIQSGIGAVHNTYLLEGAEKTVLRSPLTMFPKPMWFSTHRCPEAVATALLELYKKPSALRVPGVLMHAIRG